MSSVEAGGINCKERNGYGMVIRGERKKGSKRRRIPEQGEDVTLQGRKRSTVILGTKPPVRIGWLPFAWLATIILSQPLSKEWNLILSQGSRCQDFVNHALAGKQAYVIGFVWIPTRPGRYYCCFFRENACCRQSYLRYCSKFSLQVVPSALPNACVVRHFET